MPERTSYEPGTPAWVDLTSPDIDASLGFYTQLFGWGVTEPDPVERSGGYRLFTKNDKLVAGIGPMRDGTRTKWFTYISVDDADATAQKVLQAKGKVIMPPTDIVDAGRAAIFRDSADAAFAVWQPKKHIGAELVNEHGALVWNELSTRATDKAKQFFGDVFGWQTKQLDLPDDMNYTEWMLNGTPVGGMMEMNQNWPDSIPPHWLVYFASDDVDETAAQAAKLGGAVRVPPQDVEPGRFAVLNDPHGAVFSVITLK